MGCLNYPECKYTKNSYKEGMNFKKREYINEMLTMVDQKGLKLETELEIKKMENIWELKVRL